MAFEIPLSPQPQSFTITLAGIVYTFTVQWRDALDGGWYLDIGDASNNPLVVGIPLVTGCDLLAQYTYLGIGGQLIVTTDQSPDTPPTFANLGILSHVIFTPTS